MKRGFKYLVFLLYVLGSQLTLGQVNEKVLGSWLTYAFNADLNNSNWGFQGDFQLRNWKLATDLEQLLLRSGVHYTPTNTRLKFTLGYAYVKSSYYGSSKTQNQENRIYQEIRYPHKVGDRYYLSHRFRFEQRFIERQDFRTRFRYAFGIDIPLNKTLLTSKTWFATAYDEVFINGQRDIGNDTEVDLLDRNRVFLGLGYTITTQIRTTFGFLRQNTQHWSKNQIVLSFIQSF